jgi:hypothetical protein
MIWLKKNFLTNARYLSYPKVGEISQRTTIPSETSGRSTVDKEIMRCTEVAKNKLLETENKLIEPERMKVGMEEPDKCCTVDEEDDGGAKQTFSVSSDMKLVSGLSAEELQELSVASVDFCLTGHMSKSTADRFQPDLLEAGKRLIQYFAFSILTGKSKLLEEKLIRGDGYSNDNIKISALLGPVFEKIIPLREVILFKHLGMIIDQVVTLSEEIANLKILTYRFLGEQRSS